MIVSKVAQIISGQQLARIEPGDTVRNTCKIMCTLDAGAVAVRERETLVGVLSERDVIRKCICADRHTVETRVAEFMTGNPKTVSADSSLAEALEIMNQGCFQHVPVLHDGVTIGMISADDIPEEYRMLLERFKAFRES